MQHSFVACGERRAVPDHLIRDLASALLARPRSFHRRRSVPVLLPVQLTEARQRTRRMHSRDQSLLP